MKDLPAATIPTLNPLPFSVLHTNTVAVAKGTSV
jgi:hypothetical protein